MSATSAIFGGPGNRDRHRPNDQNGRADRDRPGRWELVLIGEGVSDGEVLGELADLLADKLAARSNGTQPQRAEALVDAREIARRTGRTRRWVYDHAGELGAVPLGSGSRPRLGFSPAGVAAKLEAASKPGPPLPAPARAQPQRRRPKHSATVEALLNGRI
jgi:hypothetical protein